MISRSAIVHLIEVKTECSHVQVVNKGTDQPDLIIIIYGSIKGNRKKRGLKTVLSLYEFHDLKITIPDQINRRFIDSLTVYVSGVRD